MPTFNNYCQLFPCFCQWNTNITCIYTLDSCIWGGIRSVMVYVHIMLIFHGNIHGNNWQYLLNVGIWIKCITTTYRRSNTKTCFGRSTKGGLRRGGGRSPFFQLSASMQKQSNTFSMTKVSCRRAVKNIAKISALSWYVLNWFRMHHLQYKFQKFPGGMPPPHPLAFFITFSNTGQFFLSLGWPLNHSLLTHWCPCGVGQY